MNNKPNLYLIPTPIGNLDDITIRALKTLELVDVIFCEDTRETTKLLHHYHIKNKLVSCHEFNEEKMKEKVLSYLQLGSNVGVVTDQGTPLISDPGYKIVEFIIEHHYTVISLPGPTAFVPALSISGLPPQPYLFYGFLNANEVKQKKELEILKVFPYTVIFYEAPHRILKTLQVLNSVFGDRKACVVREISKKYETAYYGSLTEIKSSINEPKGEFVIVVEGARTETELENLSISEHIELYLADGMSTNDAIKKVAKERHIAKSIIYKEYHQSKEGE